MEVVNCDVAILRQSDRFVFLVSSKAQADLTN